ncbi:MAG: maleylacetate reductase, partial [Caldilineaceae bacterium]|nr:maleylacetate reductase [Caldilineaceae bacterium]
MAASPRCKPIWGGRLVAIYAEVSAHVPEEEVAAALALAKTKQVDAVIGLGGGSAIGLAKAVAMALEAQRDGVRQAVARFPTDQPQTPNIAIPTTYAGSEMTPIYGVTHTLADGATRKVTVRDPKIAPKLVIYDPELTLELPASVTAATGVNALAHCVEALYSVTRNPLSSAAASDGIRHITAALPKCLADGRDWAARTEMLVGAHLAGLSLASVKMGIHHGTCHVLGGSAGLPHGVANAIILPHAMRFNLPVAAPQLAHVAVAMGVNARGLGEQEADVNAVSAAAEAAADAVAGWIARLGLPQ